MSNKLLVVGLAGVAISVVCITAALGVGGRTVLDNFGDIGMFNNGPRCDISDAGQNGSRSLAWSGGDQFTLDIPANVQYQRGQGDMVVVSGDNAILRHLRLDDGALKLDCRMRNWHRRLDVTLPGREFRSFAVNGSGSLHLAALDQQDLTLKIAGSGEIHADGKADELAVRIAGSGDTDLGALTAQRVAIEIAGSGAAEVAPVEHLQVGIAGSGDITLRTEPRSLEEHIAGSGKIIHADGSESTMHGLNSHSEGD